MIPRTTAGRLRLAGAIGLVAAVIAGAVLWARTDGRDPSTSTPPATSVPAGALVDHPADSTLLATPKRDIDRFDGPDGEVVGTVRGTWHERISTLPVIEQVPGWVHVRLPERPNGSTGWVRTGDVTLASTPYRIEIDVAEMRLRLFDGGEEVLDAPAGIGTDAAPTPLGNYFVTFLQEPPDDTPGWGPFVMVTSAHSETISDFQQSGDAIAAIHGPLDSASVIGDSGAKVSLGCVRLLLDDLAKLRVVPAGAPVDVVDTAAAS